jgi:hypothetical protein
MRQRPAKPADRESAPRFKKKDASVEDRLPLASSRALLKATLSEEDMVTVLIGLNISEDPTVAIMGAAYLENRLELLLAQSFRQLPKDEYARIFDGAKNGILGSFASKIRMAYATKLIHRNPCKALFLINAIRVAFAHSLTIVKFDNPLIIKDCGQLRLMSSTLTFASALIPAENENAREVYLKIVTALYISLDAARIKMASTRGGSVP